MALTLGGTSGIVGAGITTLDASGLSVTGVVTTTALDSSSVQKFTINGSEAVRITSDSDVVVNDTTADGNVHQDTKFHVNGGITFRELTSASEGALPAITQWSYNGTGQDLVIGARSNSGAVIFHTGNTGTDGDWGASSNDERLRIKSDGKVGIGTTNPSTVLDVNGVISTGSVLSSGIVEVSNQPAVAAYLSSTVDHSGTPSTVPFDAETFDHGGCFNATSSAATLNGISVPAHAFLPNVAGIYHVSVTAASGSSTSGSITDFHVALRKNSTDIGTFDADPKDTAPENIASGHISMLVEMNGTSDFLIVKIGATTSGTARHLAGVGRCTFNAHKLII